MNYQRFYSELGKLIYAASSIQGLIPSEEKNKLISSINDMLIPMEKHRDQFGENVVSYVIAELDFLDEQAADPMASFDSFLDFIEQHYTGVDQLMLNVLQLIFKRVSVYSDSISNRTHKLIKRYGALLEKIKKQSHRIYSPPVPLRRMPAQRKYSRKRRILSVQPVK